jgi:DNA-binding CsgD family transcriptional regulator
MATSSLPNPDLQALRAVNDALLDPLSYETTEAWMLDVCGRFKALCRAPAGFAAFSFTNGAARFVSRELSQKYLDRMSELALSEPGRLGAGHPSSEQLMDGLRERVSGVATTADLLGPGGYRVDDLQDSPMFRDVAFPLGVPGSTLLFHSGASGEFMVHAAYPEIEHRAFGADTEEVLGALLPALGASAGALARLGNARRAIAALLDALEDGAVVFDPAGRKVLARNAAICALTRQESDTAGLERRILESVLAASWQPKTAKSGPTVSNTHALSGAWRSRSGTPYRLRTVRLPAGSLAKGEAILVLVQRVRPSVPKPPDLMRRFGLTRRESEVAHYLAYGRSDREISAELGLSTHTVRHHAEAIFIKVGVTSRKALALHLGSSNETS